MFFAFRRWPLITRDGRLRYFESTIYHVWVFFIKWKYILFSFSVHLHFINAWLWRPKHLLATQFDRWVSMQVSAWGFSRTGTICRDPPSYAVCLILTEKFSVEATYKAFQELGYKPYHSLGTSCAKRLAQNPHQQARSGKPIQPAHLNKLLVKRGSSGCVRAMISSRA